MLDRELLSALRLIQLVKRLQLRVFHDRHLSLKLLDRVQLTQLLLDVLKHLPRLILFLLSSLAYSHLLGLAFQKCLRHLVLDACFGDDPLLDHDFLPGLRKRDLITIALFLFQRQLTHQLFLLPFKLIDFVLVALQIGQELAIDGLQVAYLFS